MPVLPVYIIRYDPSAAWWPIHGKIGVWRSLAGLFLAFTDVQTRYLILVSCEVLITNAWQKLKLTGSEKNYLLLILCYSAKHTVDVWFVSYYLILPFNKKPDLNFFRIALIRSALLWRWTKLAMDHTRRKSLKHVLASFLCNQLVVTKKYLHWSGPRRRITRSSHVVG